MAGPRTRRALTIQPTVLAVLHPKGGVGRSTTVWQIGAELALRGKRVRIEDLDQGRHLSRVFERHPLGLPDLQLAASPMDDNDADVVLLDTAPEAQRERALEILRRADWLLVPVKGPEEGSVQALPALSIGSRRPMGPGCWVSSRPRGSHGVSRCATGSAS